MIGSSYGGVMVMLAAGRGLDFRAGVSFAGPSITWPDAPSLQDVLLEAMASTAVPLFLIQAWDDVHLTPTYALGATLAATANRTRSASTIGSAPSPATATACSTRRCSGGYPTSSGSLSAGSAETTEQRDLEFAPSTNGSRQFAGNCRACIAPPMPHADDQAGHANDRRAKANQSGGTSHNDGEPAFEGTRRRDTQAPSLETRRRAGAGATR